MCVCARVQVLDVGTGGGLPGLPLAICYPNVKFTLIDGTGKKIAAVTDMAGRLGLTNVRTFHVRAEEVSVSFAGLEGGREGGLARVWKEGTNEPIGVFLWNCCVSCARWRLQVCFCRGSRAPFFS